MAESKITTDKDGFVYIDGVKICQRITGLGKGEGAVLRFFDKCRRRSSERGSRFVDVPASKLVEAVEKGSDHG